jgi:hypothetical protein
VVSESKSLLHFLSDPRLALYATSGVPVWLWSADATRILWGNPTAAAIFNAASPAALSGHVIDPKGSAALQIARLAGTLPHGAAPRLERLRGFGGRLGGALLCNCARIMLADRTPAILVVATEAAGPKLSLGDQAKRLLANIDDAVAVFLPDGALLYATTAAQQMLGRNTSLAALDAMALAATAHAAGKASGTIEGGSITLERIGMDTSAVLLAALTRVEKQAAAVAATILPPAPEVKSETPAAAPPSVAEPAVTAVPAEAEAPVERAGEPPVGPGQKRARQKFLPRRLPKRLPHRHLQPRNLKPRRRPSRCFAARRTAGRRCASSGRSMPTAASRSHPTSSSG